MIVLDIYIFTSESRSARVTQNEERRTFCLHDILRAASAACSVCLLERGPCMVQEDNELAARDLPARLVHTEPNLVPGRQAIRIGMQCFSHGNVLFPP